VSRFLRFCVAGTIGFVIDAGVLLALVGGLGMDPYVARVLSFLAAATATWWINRRYTFESRVEATRSEWTKYVTLMLAGAAVNYGAYAVCIAFWGLARAHLWLAVAIGSVAGLAVNYLTSSRLVFRPPAAPG
jgi:putative flippase GtrA